MVLTMPSVLAALFLFSILQQEISTEAMEWFRKGEDLVGTSEQFSPRQAEYFERAVQLSPNFAAARYNLALVYFKLNQMDRALVQLEALVKLAPDDVGGYLLRGRLRKSRGEWDGAASDFGQVVRLQPDHHRAWALLGEVRYEQGHFSEALPALQQVLQLHPDSLEAHFDLAITFYQLGRLEEAAHHGEEFLRHFPDDFDTHYLLGAVYLRRGDRNRSLEHWSKAEVLRPDHADLRLELGRLYLDLGQMEEAHKRLSEVVSPTSDSLFDLGFIAKKKGDYPRAEKLFREALLKDSKNGLLWSHLGDVLSQQQRWEEAAQAYGTAVFYSPEDFDTLFNLGTLYARVDRLEQARIFLERALQQNPDSAEVHQQLANVLDRDQQEDGALEHYLKALERGHDTASLHFRLAFLLAKQSRKDEALAHLKIALEREPEQFAPQLLKVLESVESDLDSIRYTSEFGQILDEALQRVRENQESEPESAAQRPALR